MPKTRVPYSPEFRRQMVDLVRAGRDPDDLGREFEPTAQSIRNWIMQADKKEGRREEALPGLIAAERDELTRLRRENRQLRVERDILSKAAAGLNGRPARCRRALPVHEHEPGLLPGCHHGARDGRGVPVSCCRAGRLEPQDRRLVDGQPPAGGSWCWTRWRRLWASDDRRTSSITAIRAANTRPSHSANGAARLVSGPQWNRLAMPTITPWLKASSRRWKPSCSAAAGSHRRPRPAWLASATSRAGTTRHGYTQV